MGLSAKRLGEKIGFTAQQMNVFLKDEGYLEGPMGNYSLTDKGKAVCEEKSWHNGYGGYASRGYDYNTYPETILEKMNLKPENLERIKEKTKQEKIESLKIKEELQKQYNRERLMENVQNITVNKSSNTWIVIGLLSLVTLGVGYWCWNRKKKKEKFEEKYNQ